MLIGTLFSGIEGYAFDLQGKFIFDVDRAFTTEPRYDRTSLADIIYFEVDQNEVRITSWTLKHVKNSKDKKGNYYRASLREDSDSQEVVLSLEQYFGDEGVQVYELLFEKTDEGLSFIGVTEEASRADGKIPPPMVQAVLKDRSVDPFIELGKVGFSGE
ncbi:MAG: hypothetical protein CL678_06330 [Bdellovibrionaceae bacterium]|nr:hypothetical protein [Pseudobdellovibrionaceae bacterium]